MKVGIITFTTGNNYGQRLQNYAMEKIVEEHGHIPYTIRFKNKNRSILSAARILLNWLKNIKKYNRIKRRTKVFDKFNREFINIYRKESNTNSSDVDRYIAGSDQIWNPYSPDVDSNMFLQFTTKDKRAAYAPSFSVNFIPEDRKNEIKNYLLGFENNSLSIREEQGARIIKDLIGIDVPIVLDPTLLIETDIWREFENPLNRLPNNYILFYVLGEVNEDLELIKKLGYPVIDLMNDPEWFSSVGPREFLYLIDNAKFIITDSYHGSIFSILFNKEFRNIRRKTEGFDMGSRLDTLYNKLNLPLATVLEDFNFKENIDYKKVQDHLEIEKLKSLKYLENILS